MYLLLVVLVIPSFIMIFSYSAISNEVFGLVKRRTVMTNMLSDTMHMSSISPSSSFSKANVDRKKARAKAIRNDSSLCHKQKKFNEKSHMIRIIPMLVLVIAIFIICWAPLLIFSVLQSFNIIPTQLFGALKHLKTGLSLAAYFNR